MKKQLLFINGHLNTGGVEKSLVDILRHMDYSRYEVELLLLEDLGDYAPELPPEVHVRLMDLHNTYGSLPNALLRCVREQDWFCLQMRIIMLLAKLRDARQFRRAGKLLFGDQTYDAVVGFRSGICTSVAAFAASSPCKLTWWHHGEYNLYGDTDSDYRLTCAEMRHIVAVSEGCAAFLRDKLPEFNEKLTVIPNLLAVDDIQAKAKAFLPYEKSGLTLVSVGRLSSEKHFENIIFTARQLVEHGIQNFQWLLVGDGAGRAHLEQMVSEANLTDYIGFAGSQPNPYPYMANADLFVHPSYVESQGLVVLEAMALGVPCVVTKSLGPCEFIEDGVNGILTEQSAESLAEKVELMLTDRALYERIKANTRCPEQFAPEHVMQKIDKLLEEK